MIRQIKTKAEFPVRDGEEFVVRNGDGQAVERWHHRSSFYGKTTSRHTYDVDEIIPE